MTAVGARKRKKTFGKYEKSFIYKITFKNIAKFCNPKIRNPLRFQESAIRGKSFFLNGFLQESEFDTTIRRVAIPNKNKQMFFKGIGMSYVWKGLPSLCRC